MKSLGALKKLVMVLSFLAFLTAGYVTVNTNIAKAADQSCCCTICVMTGLGVGFAIQMIGSTTVIPGIAQAGVFISMHIVAPAIAFGESIVQSALQRSTNIDDWFNTYWYYQLLPSMQDMTRQLNTLATDQVRNRASIIDAVNQNRVQKALENQSVNSQRELRPSESVCVAATAMSSMTRAAVIQRSYNAAAPVEHLPRSANKTGTAAAAGSFADSNVRWQDYVTRYCRAGYNNGASGCTADASLADQDIDVTGTIFAKDTIDIKGNAGSTKKTVDDLIINIAEPFVKDPVAAGAADSSGGQQMILEAESYKARRQVVQDTLYHVTSRRMPTGGGNGDLVREMRQDSIGASAVPLSSTSSSHNEIMKAMMTERFRSGKYALGQVDEPENNQREMVVQQALQLMQMSDQLDLMDRYSLLLAAQAAAEVRASKPLGTALSGASLK